MTNAVCFPGLELSETHISSHSLSPLDYMLLYATLAFLEAPDPSRTSSFSHQKPAAGLGTAADEGEAAGRDPQSPGASGAAAGGSMSGSLHTWREQSGLGSSAQARGAEVGSQALEGKAGRLCWESRHRISQQAGQATQLHLTNEDAEAPGEGARSRSFSY